MASLARSTRLRADEERDRAGPHQATKVGDRFLVYDGNGNTVRERRDHGDPTCTVNADHLRSHYWSDDRLDAVADWIANGTFKHPPRPRDGAGAGNRQNGC